MIMSAPLHCAVIGCGAIAPTHAECLRLCDGVELAWACDLVEDKARRIADRYGFAQTTTDYRRVLDDPSVDCVCICTDHASHAPIAISAIEAGKHVLCEKALSATREGLDAMLACHAQRADIVFSGVFQHRFDAGNRCLKRLVEDGALGRVLTAGLQMRCLRTDAYYHADKWRGTWALEGGALLINQAIHFIDQLTWVAGAAESVCGAYANLTHAESIECEDTAVASIRFRGGALGSLEATSSSHIGWEPTLAVHGTEGSVELRDGHAVKVSFEDAQRQEQVARELESCRDAPGVEAGKGYYGSGHAAQIADFLSAVREGREPFVPAHSARHAVDLVLAIYEAHHCGGWVDVRSLCAIGNGS
jgi:UDP-N-acetyl-2-amino-2-deoxyglucuronate dehydrogenase